MSTGMGERQLGQGRKMELICKILIAIDFGTTFSGTAWAQTRKPEVQTIVVRWPDATSGGLEGMSNEEAPTELQYNGQNYKRGYQIGEDGQRYQWFKLDLDASQSSGTSELARHFPDPMTAPPGYDTSPDKMTTDYLTALRKHAEKILRYKLPGSALQSLPIEFIITVPAVWSDAAKAKTRLCAEQAGMGLGHDLHIISEPEAAAVYALDVLDPHKIEVGDTFVLCDAGGGTVDLISYTVTALKPSLEITEATPGTGALCGSTFLNRRFEKFLEENLGNEPGWDKDVLDDIKKQFRGIEGEEFKVPVPSLPNNPRLGVSRGKLSVSGNDVRKVFEPIVHEVNKLVMDQVGTVRRAVKNPKAVVMVGGFGQNAYLRASIRALVASSNKEVLQSPNGCTAVVLSYEQLHLEAHGHPSEIVVPIDVCSDRDNTGAPMYPDSDDVARLVLVKADLSLVPLAAFPKATGADGRSYYEVEFDIEVTCYSAYTKFELIYDGKNYGPTAAEYVQGLLDGLLQTKSLTEWENVFDASLFFHPVYYLK